MEFKGCDPNLQVFARWGIFVNRHQFQFLVSESGADAQNDP